MNDEYSLVSDGVKYNQQDLAVIHVYARHYITTRMKMDLHLKEEDLLGNANHHKPTKNVPYYGCTKGKEKNQPVHYPAWLQFCTTP